MSSDQAVKWMMLRIMGFPMTSVPGWEALARSAYMVLIWTMGGLPWIGMVGGAMYMLPWAWYSQKAQAAAMYAGERDLDAESHPDGPDEDDDPDEDDPDRVCDCQAGIVEIGCPTCDV